MTNSHSDFHFKEIDPEGFATLQVISEARRFNAWTFDIIRPYCKGRILEIGSGIGNISTQFVQNSADITVSDIRKNYRDFLATEFPSLNSQGKILDIDLADPQISQTHAAIAGTFDTVFALNVVEHIQNDQEAIRNCAAMLKPGGSLIILVPAFQWLYNSFDQELFHFKRYSKSDLSHLFTGSGIQVQQSFYFNAGGIPGWFLSGKIQKNKTIPAGQMKTFDKLVPVFRLIDKALFRWLGLSVVAVGTKSGN